MSKWMSCEFGEAWSLHIFSVLVYFIVSCQEVSLLYIRFITVYIFAAAVTFFALRISYVRPECQNYIRLCILP